jgi:hypothetical protein
LLPRLLELFRAKAPSGAPCYSEFEIQNCLAMLQLSLGESLLAGPGASKRAHALKDFFGLDGTESGADAARKIEAHYRAHPIPVGLQRGLEQLIRAFTLEEAGDGAARFSKLFGDRSAPPDLLRRERPPGTTAAGPLARFTLAQLD